MPWRSATATTDTTSRLLCRVSIPSSSAKNHASRQRIFVAGHRGLVGSAIVRDLLRQGYATFFPHAPAFDLLDKPAVERSSPPKSPTLSFSPRPRSAASSPTDLPGRLYPRQSRHPDQRDRGQPQRRRQAPALPRLQLHLSQARPQPIKEEYLLTGPLEPTNRPYAMPKSPASRCAGATTASMAPATSPPCPPTSTAPATTSTWQTRTCCPR